MRVNVRTTTTNNNNRTELANVSIDPKFVELTAETNYYYL